MKKMMKFAMSVLTVCVAMIVMTVTVFAEVKDVELSTTRASMCPAWGQSITYTASDFKIADFTEDTEVIIEYETDGGAMPDNGYNPAELIFQNYSSDPQVWCQISPYEYDETTAKFAYSDMVAAYADLGGMEDLSDVNNVCVGATFVGVKVTKVTVTNCEVEEATTTVTTTAATTEATTTEAVTEATTEATTAASSSSSGGGIPIVLIVVITVVVAVAVVVTIIIIKGKKRFY